VAAFERHLNSRVSNRKLRLEVFCTATPEQADSLELLERLARETQKPFLFDKSFAPREANGTVFGPSDHVFAPYTRHTGNDTYA
jgi:hypothetical protein